MLIQRLPIESARYVKEFKKQEQKLSKMLRQLRQKSDGSEQLTETLNAMMEYAQVHFKSEEALMKKLDYPKMEFHKSQHIKFLETLTQFCMDIVERRSDPTKKVVDFLDGWIKGHIAEEDSQLQHFIIISKELN